MNPKNTKLCTQINQNSPKNYQIQHTSELTRTKIGPTLSAHSRSSLIHDKSKSIFLSHLHA